MKANWWKHGKSAMCINYDKLDIAFYVMRMSYINRKKRITRI